MSGNLLPERRGPSQPLLFRLFFFGAFGFLLYQMLRVLMPFVNALLVAVTLALVFYPIHSRVLRWLRGRANLASCVSVTGLLLMVVLPAVLLMSLLGREAAGIYPWARQQVLSMRSDPQAAFETRLPAPLRRIIVRGQEALERAGVNPREMLLDALEGLGGQASALGASILKNALLFVLQTLVMMFILFFLFRDGPRAAQMIVHLVPMEESHKAHILERLNQTLTAVVRGMFITAAVQGLLAGAGYAVAGVRFAVVLGFVTAIMALIPLVGAGSIWIPVSIFLMLKGQVGTGIGLALWGALVVSTVDNFLRPLIIGEKAKLPILFLFLATLGGLKAYGPVGLLMGPLLVACVLAFVKIYGEQLARSLRPPEPAPAPPAA